MTRIDYNEARMKVSLFVTCIVDQFFPSVGVATMRLLERLGARVSFNPEQTCCGQPAFNTGYRDEAREVAAHMLGVFERELEHVDYIVAPSGSCVTMVSKFYAELFESDPAARARVEAISPRVMELSEFIVGVLGVTDAGSHFQGRVTYHDSCHLLRELRVSAEPRGLISAVRGAVFVEMDRADACCGFGGTFSVKYAEISAAIGEEKVSSIARSGADAVVACDAGCLMRIASLLESRGSAVRCMHIAELLEPSQ
jgi:L-lactate dehydrogenase complex protein LldE